MQAVVDAQNLARAWARMKANRGAPGIGGTPTEAFPAFARAHWSTIRQAVLRGDYRPQPVRQALIPKAGVGPRWEYRP